MSYVRWSEDSSVYVYGSEVGLVCCDCLMSYPDITGPSGDFITESPREMIAHLMQHRDVGDKVPDYAIESLQALEDEAT